MSMQARISAERSASLDDVAQLSAAVALYNVDQCGAALPYLVEASASQPLLEEGVNVYGPTMFYRATCEYDQGLIPDAIASYQAALDYPYDFAETDTRIFPESAAINLAWIYVQRGEQKQAMTLLDAYTTTDYGTYGRREIERFLERADIYLALGANDAAIAEITSLIEIAKDKNAAQDEADFGEFSSEIMARLYTERGRRYLQIDRTAQALADFEQARWLDDQYPKAYYWRGLAYYKQGALDQSRTDFEQFLTLAPDYYEYYEEDLAPYIEQAKGYLALLTAGATPDR